MSTPNDTTTTGPVSVDPGLVEAEALGVDYQRTGQVRQMLAERANAVAYGMIDRVVSIDVSLSVLGYTGDRTIGATGSSGPLGRQARSDKTVQADAPTVSKGVTSDFLGPKTAQPTGAAKPAATPAVPADSPKQA